MCNVKNTILKFSFIAERVNRLLLLKKYELNIMTQHDAELKRTVWDPIQIIHCATLYKYAVVVLNQPIHWAHDILLDIWKKAQITVTVDGGTERWLKYLKEKNIDVLSGEYKNYLPDLITGDMDSCCPKIIEKLKSIGSMVIETPDQNETDYTKALRQIAKYVKTENIHLNAIYVLADTSGRLDHIMANINTLYKSDKIIENVPVTQIARNSLTWLLKPGFHNIVIPEPLVQHNTCCGLLPIGKPVNCITTTGLKWNLNNSCLQFGGLVSSSNTYDNCSEVTVETDTSVIWSMGIDPLINTTNL